MTRLRSDNSRKGGIDLLQQISAKDLRDVRLDVLIDHMQSRVRTTNAGYFRKYVRNPRVSNEMLTPYKTFFGKVISKEDVEAYVAEPMKIDVYKRQLLVRGGSSDETQTYIDGMHVLNPYTATGINSPARGRYSTFMFSGVNLE